MRVHSTFRPNFLPLYIPHHFPFGPPPPPSHTIFYSHPFSFSFSVLKMTASSPTVVTGRTLIVGSTGFIGKFVTEAILASGRPTYLLVRSGPTTPSKANTIKSFQDKGAMIVLGSMNDQDFMEKVLKDKKIEVVISAIGGESILDQLTIVKAIKSAGATVKRFLPSEFGHDIDRADPVEPGLRMYEEKRKVRRSIEEAGIPYTYICCNSIAAWPYHDNTHPSDVLPPLDQFQIYGDGTVKAYFVAGNDIGKFTIKSMDDDRTLNKSVHFRPSSNLLNINELASLWEKKIGRILPRVTITEDDLLASAKEMCIPRSIVAALTHDIFINGCQVNFSMDKSTDVSVTSLYPNSIFRNIDECFSDFVAKAIELSVLAKAVEVPSAIGKKASAENGTVVPSTAEALAKGPSAMDKMAGAENGIVVPNTAEVFAKVPSAIGKKAAAEDGIGVPNAAEVFAITASCA